MNADKARQYADEARQYAKELQEENKDARALGPFNEWFIRRCIRKIDKEIKKEIKLGRKYCMAVFTVNAPNALPENYKLFLADYYKSQGYHVELSFDSMGISWAVERPWWFRDKKSWRYTGNDTTLEVN